MKDNRSPGVKSGLFVTLSLNSPLNRPQTRKPSLAHETNKNLLINIS